MLKKIKANYYQQFDADFNLEVPAEGFNGWCTGDIEIDLEHTALVIMHAWDCGTKEEFPGWYRYVEYLPRANKISKEIFPDLLTSVRNSPLKIFHVVSSGSYYKNYEGYRLTKKTIKKKGYRYETIKKSNSRKKLDQFRVKNCGLGLHNKDDIDRGYKKIDFAKSAKPIGKEPIAETSEQLFKLCKHFKIDHLIYIGFAINWCLLLSPGGMADMSRYGMLCSTIREAVTAVENNFTARKELNKETALWRVALAFGFVFNLDEFITILF